MTKKWRAMAPFAGAAAVPAAFWAMATLSPALAGLGQPTPMQMGLQEAATPVADAIHDFNTLISAIIIGIVLFVVILLGFVLVRFNERANPVPSKTAHNTLLEVVWTVVPILILVVIAIPSFKLLNLQYSYPKPDLVIKTTAYQWYWSYEYPDQGGFTFDSVILQDDERKERVAKGWPEDQVPRLLAVDNEAVVPVNKVVHLIVTAADVIHSWTVPSFGSKIDAVPGRITATWFQPRKEGVYFGQCSELCGVNHAFMPIAVRVVKEDVFQDWAAAMKAKDKKKAREILRQAAAGQADMKVAAAGTERPAP